MAAVKTIAAEAAPTLLANSLSWFSRITLNHERYFTLKRPANPNIDRVRIDVGAQAIHAEAGAASEFKLETEARCEVVADADAVGNGGAI